MNYKEALEYINETTKFGSKLGLERIKHLLESIGNPHKKLKVIHVAGTNGKGSTASFIASILIESGYNVGLYTSPSLETFNERIRINNECISNDDLAKVTSMVKSRIEEMLKKGIEHPTEFEIVTAIAFQYFMEKDVDYVVLEVGLGGRYDSTNIIENPIACVITPISMDHMDRLGNTLKEIAWEKAGIIKENTPVISHPQEKEAYEVIQEVCTRMNSQLLVVPLENINISKSDEYGSRFDFNYGKYTIKNLEISLLGRHQIVNSAVALSTVLYLDDKGIINISESSIRRGLKKATWKGRLEILKRNPYFVIDGAHNLHGIEALRKALSEIFKYNKLILGISILADKDVDEMLKKIIPLADTVIVTQADSSRVTNPYILGEKVKEYNSNCIVIPNIEEAVKRAQFIAKKDDLIIFCGSLYLIKDVRKFV